MGHASHAGYRCDKLEKCSQYNPKRAGRHASSTHVGTSSPSQALRGTGPHASRVSAASVQDDMQCGRKGGYAKTSRPTLGTHSKLLRALSGAASGQVHDCLLHSCQSVAVPHPHV